MRPLLSPKATSKNLLSFQVSDHILLLFETLPRSYYNTTAGTKCKSPPNCYSEIPYGDQSLRNYQLTCIIGDELCMNIELLVED